MDAVTLGVRCWEDKAFVVGAAATYNVEEVSQMRANLIASGHRYMSEEVKGLERLIEALRHDVIFY